MNSFEHLFRTIAETAVDYIFSKDINGRYTYVNPAMARLLEQPAPRLLGLNAEQVFGKEAARIIGEVDKQALQGRDANAVRDLVIGTKTFTFHTIQSPIYENDRIVGIYGIVRDVTPQQQAHKELIISTNNYRLTMDAMPNAIHLINREYQLLLVNQRMKDWLKRLKVDSQIEGLDLFRAFPFLGENIKDEYETVFASGGILTTEERNLVGGRYVYTETVKIPIKDDHEVDKVLTVISDITERKKTEAAMIRLQKMESIGLLAGGIAHDFNNYLNGMHGYITLAMSHLENRNKVLEYLMGADKATFQAQGLTNQLLSFSRTQPSSAKPLKIKDVLKDSLEFVLHKSSIKSELRIPEAVPLIMGNDSQLHQVFNNLIINAEQAMSGKGHLEITASLVSLKRTNPFYLDAGDYVEVSLKDDGKGISEADKDRVFDPYYTTKKKGSGLGLSTAYSIIQRHSGTISLNAVEGEGAEFLVYLPVADVEIGAQPEKTRKAKQDLTGKRVLFMDESPVIQQMVTEMLRSFKCDVVCTDSGENLRELCEKAIEDNAPFDVVIIELISLDGKGGRDICRLLKKHDPVMIVIASSSCFCEDQDYDMYPEFNAFLCKPFTVSSLKQVLTDLFSAKLSSASPNIEK